MSNRLFLGLLAAGLAVSFADGCQHTGGGKSGAAGSGPQGGAGSGTAGSSSGQGGSGPGSAGTTGTGDASGIAGTTGSGATTGSAGTTGTGNASGSAGAVGTAGTGGMASSVEMIDNLEDNDARIITANGRQGVWHSFNDANSSNIQPPLGTGFVAAAGGANNTAYAVHTTGSGFQFGGVGFDLNNAQPTPESSLSMAY